MSFRYPRKCHWQASWLSSDENQNQALPPHSKGKPGRNVLVAGSFLQQNSSTFEFSHYLLRRRHPAHKARSQGWVGRPTAAKSLLHPGYSVSNIPSGCSALRVSIKGAAEEGGGCGYTGQQQIYTPQLSFGDRHTTQKTALASQSTGMFHTASASTLTPRFLVPHQLRRDTLTISRSIRTIHSEFLWSK